MTSIKYYIHYHVRRIWDENSLAASQTALEHHPPEELLIRCRDPNRLRTARSMAAVSPEVTVTGYQEDAAYHLPLRAEQAGHTR